MKITVNPTGYKVRVLTLSPECQADELHLAQIKRDLDADNIQWHRVGSVPERVNIRIGRKEGCADVTRRLLRREAE